MNVRKGITLIELLISMTLSMIILLVMLGAFRVASQQMTKGRANLEMATQIRNVVETMRSDLENVTVPLRPNSIEASSNGYFTIVEGPLMDDIQIIDILGVPTPTAIGNNLANPQVAGASYLGDYDDILAMTVRSPGRPFRGRWVNPGTAQPEIVESYVAEIMWWVRHDPTVAVNYGQNLTLHRRVLLVRPDLTTNYTNMGDYYADNDIAARPVAGPAIVMNSLGDLTKRENRFNHIRRANAILGFPHEIDRSLLANRHLTGERQGEDIMLSSIAAFDIKVFSPNCPVQEYAQQIVAPSDPGFNAVGTMQAEGAYVDLGFAQRLGFAAPFWNAVWFAQYPDPRSQLNLPGIVDTTGCTWCTWSSHYEYDGIDQDGNGIIDQGTDGIDNNNSGGVDDEMERETRPPYGFPIRSLQVNLRVIEKRTGQVRQQTIRHSFVPE